MIEISNQQAFLDKPHMPLSPRIELTGKQTCTSLSDFDAAITLLDEQMGGARQVIIEAKGRLLTASHKPPAEGEARYHLIYSLRDSLTTPQSSVEIIATVDAASQTPLQFILPVISSSNEAFTQPDPKTILITKPKGTLTIRTTAPNGFAPTPKERTFNLVPGFECIPLTITMQPGQEIQIHLDALETRGRIFP
jgi:hypothetical protein